VEMRNDVLGHGNLGLRVQVHNSEPARQCLAFGFAMRGAYPQAAVMPLFQASF
jgi:hypothetical protein